MTTLAGVFGLTWWGFVLLYLLAGWLVAGVFVWFRQPMNNVRMIVCLVAWWGALGAFVIGALVVAVAWVFHPDAGPIAMFVHVVQAASRPRVQTTAEPPPSAEVRA